MTSIEVTVTDEMRKAVYEADCARFGHIADISQAISNDPHNNVGVNTPTIRCDDPHKMPHITCRRCGKVWLILEQPGDTYDHALDQLNSQLLARFKRASRPPDVGTIQPVSVTESDNGAGSTGVP